MTIIILLDLTLANREARRTKFCSYDNIKLSNIKNNPRKIINRFASKLSVKTIQFINPWGFIAASIFWYIQITLLGILQQIWCFYQKEFQFVECTNNLKLTPQNLNSSFSNKTKWIILNSPNNLFIRKKNYS